MPNCLSYLTANLFLFCSKLVTQLLSTSFKKVNYNSRLFQKQKKFSYSTLAQNFKDWPFGVILTWHFRSKSGNLSDSVYCKPIDRTSKMFFTEGSGNILRPAILDLWKLLVFGYKNKYKKILKIISSKNNSFHNLQKVSKSTVPNTMAVDL